MFRKKLTGTLIVITMVIVMAWAAVGASAAASGGIAYTNSNFNFSLTLPASWNGLYRAEERSNDVRFINIRNENAGYGGFVFGIYISNNTDPAEWGYKELARSGGKYYYGATPSDVQFDYSNESRRNEYAAMEKDIDSIFASFRLNAASITARPTASTVLVDGKKTTFDAYNIGGSNYFKLRDLAYVLRGTAKQFDVGWDRVNNAISLTSGKRYTPIGGEMAGKGAGDKNATPTTSKVYLDGKEVAFAAYNIGGNNYFKLRDIGETFNFGVDWDRTSSTIAIDTTKVYTPESSSAAQSGDSSDRTNEGRDFRSELIGLWHASQMLGSGWSNRLAIFDDGTFIFATSQMDGETRERFIKGDWSVNSDGFLTLVCRTALRWQNGKVVPATGSIGTETEIINADVMKITYDPPEKVIILVGNYIYSEGNPHPWSIFFSDQGSQWDTRWSDWWWKYETEPSYDTFTLIQDYESMEATSAS